MGRQRRLGRGIEIQDEGEERASERQRGLAVICCESPSPPLQRDGAQSNAFLGSSRRTQQLANALPPRTRCHSDRNFRAYPQAERKETERRREGCIQWRLRQTPRTGGWCLARGRPAPGRRDRSGRCLIGEREKGGREGRDSCILDFLSLFFCFELQD